MEKPRLTIRSREASRIALSGQVDQGERGWGEGMGIEDGRFRNGCGGGCETASGDEPLAAVEPPTTQSRGFSPIPKSLNPKIPKSQSPTPRATPRRRRAWRRPSPACRRSPPSPDRKAPRRSSTCPPTCRPRRECGSTRRGRARTIARRPWRKPCPAMIGSIGCGWSPSGSV